jgi:hypothetical protein
MIDNLKIQIANKAEFEKFIISNKIIDLETSINQFTGEIKEYPKKGKLKNLDISITPLYAYVGGSLHKYNNLLLEDANHNYNDFSFCQINEIIPFLTDKLDIGDKTSITNLEFGFNLTLDKNPQEVLDYNVLMHNLKNHSRDDKFGGKGDFKEYKKTDYSIKIYNKSKQYNINQYILRIEIKITKKRFLQKLGIYCLEDLLKFEAIYGLYERLKTEVDNLTVIDDFYALNIPKNDRDSLVTFTNPHYWINIRKEKSNKVVRRLETKFHLLILKYDLNKIKTEILKKIELKFDELITDCDENLLLSNIA